MDKYLEKLVLEEKMRLEKHIAYAIEAYNAIKKDILEDIVVVKTYKHYNKVLVVKFKSKRTGFINIDVNSVLATARELATYLYQGKDRVGGFITETYNGYEVEEDYTGPPMGDNNLPHG